MCLQYGISVLIAQTSIQGETSCGITKCWLFSQVIQSLHFFGNLRFSTLVATLLEWSYNVSMQPLPQKFEMMGQPVLSVVNSHAQPILVSISFLFFVIFNYQASQKTLRKGLIQILLGVTTGEILTITIVLQQATWILRQYCDSKGTIAIVCIAIVFRNICFYLIPCTLRNN